MALAAAMMIGTVAGGLVKTVNGSLGDVEDTCKAIKVAEENQDALNKKWGKIFTNELNIQHQIEEFNNNLASHGVILASLSKVQNQQQQKKLVSTLISCSIVLFSLILGLLFKYFRIFPMIWNYIVK